MSPPAERTRMRLTHSMAEGEEIHAVLPESREEWEAALARGEIKELTERLADIIGEPG